MTKSSPWPKMLPALGIALAVALLAAAGSVWWSGSGTTTVSDGGLGELIAVTQAARAESNAAVQGDAASFDALAASRPRSRGSATPSPPTKPRAPTRAGLAADAALWQRIERNLDTVLASREGLPSSRRHAPRFSRSRRCCSRPRATSRAPCLRPISRPINLIYALRARGRIAAADARALGPRSTSAMPFGGSGRRAVSRPVRSGLARRGRHARRRPVDAGRRQADIEPISELFEQTRQAVATISSGAETLTAALSRDREFDAAAAELLTRYRDTDVSIAAVAGDASRRGCRCCLCSQRSRSRP